MNFVSLFSGCGGLDSGLERAGHKCVTQVEIDERPLAILRAQWPDVPKIKDVKNANRTNLPAFDMLAAGVPCTGFSLAGLREGLANVGSGLWFECHRIALECRPSVVLIENVPGILSSANGEDFGIILGGLLGVPIGIPQDGWRGCGIAKGVFYNVAWRILDSQFFGVAQQRRRVFIAASLVTSGINPAEILFEREGMQRNYQTRGQAREGTSDAFEGRTFRGGEIAAPITASDSKRGTNTDTFPYIATRGIANTMDTAFASKLGQNNQHIDAGGGVFRSSQRAKTLTSMNGRNDTETENFIVAKPLLASPNDKHDTTSMTYITPTMRAGGDAHSGFVDGDGIVSQKTKIRRLVPIECERLQGFEDDYTKYGSAEVEFAGEKVTREIEMSDSARYFVCGNAVTSNVANWIGLGIPKTPESCNRQNPAESR